jgi:hypothetical protein
MLNWVHEWQNACRFLFRCTSTPQWSCAHCHSSLHRGGAKKCPFGEFKAKVARRMALEVLRLSATEPGVMERLLAAERAGQEEE